MVIENWMIYAILGLLSSGFLSFVSKISAEKRLDSTLINLYAYGTAIIVSLITVLIFSNFEINLTIIVSSIIAATCGFFLYKTRILGLEHISSTAFFINYRVFSSLLVILSGLIIFKETLGIKEIFGLILGFIVFGLLIEKDKNKKISNDFKKGIKFLIIGVLLISISQIVANYVVKNNFNSLVYILFTSIFGFVISLIANYKKLNIKDLKENKNGIVLYGFLQGLLMTLAFIFVVKAYITGDIGIVYKIISFAVLIPIILSVIIYKEKITLNKFLAIILALVSIYFFL